MRFYFVDRNHKRIYSESNPVQCDTCRRWKVNNEWTDATPLNPQNFPVSHGRCDECTIKNLRDDGVPQETIDEIMREIRGE